MTGYCFSGISQLIVQREYYILKVCITCVELNHFSSQQFGLAIASAHIITGKSKNKIS